MKKRSVGSFEFGQEECGLGEPELANYQHVAISRQRCGDLTPTRLFLSNSLHISNQHSCKTSWPQASAWSIHVERRCQLTRTQAQSLSRIFASARRVLGALEVRESRDCRKRLVLIDG